jgi:TonB family protein
MSTTSVCTDNSATFSERRLQVRQPVSALAYLDIGPANGGIILNLSEEGMGFQAVSPLDSQRDINLRIQLPHSQGRIEAVAKIVWLSQSGRQGGVRFLEVSSEGRAQVHNWIGSQNSPRNSLEEPLSQVDAAVGPQRKPEVPRVSRDKWLSLMAEFEVPADPRSSRPPIVAGEEQRPSDAVAPRVAAKLTAPPIMLNPFGQRPKPTYDTRSEESPVGPDPAQGPTALAKLGADNRPTEQGVSHAGVTASSFRKPESEDALDRHVLAPRIVSPAVSDALTGPATARLAPPATRPTAAVDSEAISAAIIASTRSATLALRGPNRAPKWLGTAALLVLFSVLCFAIGTWVGSLATSDHPVQTASAPPTPAPASSAEPAPDGGAGHEAIEPTQRSTEKERAAVSHASTLHNRKHEPTSSTKPPVVLPGHQEVQSAPLEPILTSHTANMPQEGRKQLPMPPPDYSAAAAPSPATIAGRTLRPTDRFNPCHLTYRVEPAYPLEAQQQGVEGAVKIHQVIGADGSVQSVRLLSGPPLLSPAAMDAAKYWRYLPALLNGQPVDTEQDIEIDFRLPH